MSVKVEKTDNKNEIKMEFTVEAKVFEDGMKKVFTKNSKYFNIPGFRKGKAPMNVVEKYYGPEIFYEDAFNEVVPEIYDNAVKENKLEVVSRPDINIVQMEKGKDLIFTAVVSTKPDVKLGKYKGVEAEKTIYKVSKEDVEMEIKAMAEKNARLVSVTDRAVKDGDTAVIDYVGTSDGVEFQGGSAKDYELVIGSKTFIPGFEDQVIGMKIDEVKDIKVTFPEEYFSKDLAGKEANFKVTLHEIKMKEYPEIDDEFAKDVSEFDTIKELRADIKAKKEEQNKLRSNSELEETVVKAVSDASEVDIPTGMVEIEIDNIVEDMNRRLQYQGLSLEQYLKMLNQTMTEFRKHNEESAKTSIKYRLVLEAVAKDAKVEVSDKEVEDKLQELADSYGRKLEDLKKNEDLIENVKSSLTNEKAIKVMVDSAKVKEVEEKKEEAEVKEEKEEKKTTAKKTTAKKSESTASEKKETKTTTKKSTTTKKDNK